MIFASRAAHTLDPYPYIRLHDGDRISIHGLRMWGYAADQVRFDPRPESEWREEWMPEEMSATPKTAHPHSPTIVQFREDYERWVIESDGECTLGDAAREVLGWRRDAEENEAEFPVDDEEEHALRVLTRLAALA